jgi:hypothetical protein
MAEIILVALPCNAAVVDGMYGTMVIAGQTASTSLVVNPCGRCTFDIIHRTDFGTHPTTGTYVCIDRKLPVCYHPLVEIAADHV